MSDSTHRLQNNWQTYYGLIARWKIEVLTVEWEFTQSTMLGAHDREIRNKGNIKSERVLVILARGLI